VTVSERELLSPAQAARRAGVSEQSIVNWFDTGRVAGFKSPLGRLIDPVSLDRVVAERAARRGGDDDPPATA
jgi:hypothetical protein